MFRRRVASAFRVIGVSRILAFTLLPAFLGVIVDRLGSAVVLGAHDGVGGLIWRQEDTPVLTNTTFVDAKDLPLRTSGKWLVDRRGQRVRLRCVNWYGAHLATLVVGGLDKQPLRKLAFAIRALGFNCVRLPYSLEVQLRPARPAKELLRANPGLQNATGLEILDKTVAALAAARLLVVLNNHQGRAMWCCSEEDGEGLWYTAEYPERAWLDSLRSFAERYRDEPFVVGYDLRNELRGVPLTSPGKSLGIKRPDWGSGRGDTDWAAAARRGALAVSEKDPHALIFVEGLQFAIDLSGVRGAGRLHKEPELQGRVVYEAHDYCWYHPELLSAWCLHWVCTGWALCLMWEAWRNRNLKGHPAHDIRICRTIVAILLTTCWSVSVWLASYQHFAAVISERWGFLLEEGEAPVWLGEFGTNGPWVTANWWFEIGEVTWWRHILRYVRENEVDYAYWAFNGDKAGEDETFGLLAADYATLRHPWIVGALP
mmetsp:Transcript_114170/g.355528  ORF Transcript_114170/g.355528 Transcript_114170/m.355528 type:complete len:485 (-) Transcript_114170:91-1545(-)